MWDFLLALGLNLLIQLLLPQPKPPGAKKYSLGEFSYPTADETRPVPLGFGTFKVAGNLIWFGDYAAEEVRKKVRSFPTRQYQTIGYRYKVGMWMTLNASTADELLEIRVGERVVWTGTQELSKTAPTDVAVDASWTTQEGQEIREGISGTFRFFNQEADVSSPAWTPLANTYMEAQLGAGKVPAYPNMLHVVWLGPSSGGKGFVSITNNLEPLQFVFRRKADVSAALLSSQYLTFPVAGSLADANTRAAVKAWCDSKALIDGDANPELVKLEVLTSRVPGIGPRLSGDALELESIFRAADRVHSDGIGTSFTWEQTRPVAELLADLNQVSGGFTELNERTGQIRSKLARPEDVPVAVFDADNLIEIGSFTRVSLDEAPNEVVVPFVDRNLNWQSREQSVQNDAGIRAAGSTISRKVEFLGVSRSGLASFLGSRALASMSASAMKASWRAFLEVDGYMPKPGDLVILQHPVHGGLRMRVDSARFAEWNDRLSVQLEGAQDMFRNGDSSLGYTPAYPPTLSTGTTPTGTVGTQLTIRAPRALSGDAADHMLFAIAPGDSSQLSADIGWSSTDNAFTPSDPLEYASSGPTYPLAVAATLAANLDWKTKGNVAVSVTVPNAEALARLLATVSQGVPAVIWAAGAAFELSVTAHEFVRVVSASVTGSNTATLNIAARGLYDTWPQRWAAGARLMLLSGYAIDPVPLTTSLTADIANGPVLLSVGGESYSRVFAKYRNGTRTGASNYSSRLAADQGFNYGDARAMRPVTPSNVRVNGAYGAYAENDTLPTASKASGLRVTWTNRGYGTAAADWFGTGAAEAAEGLKIRCIVWVQYGYEWREAFRALVDSAVGFADIPAGSYIINGSVIRVVVQAVMPVGNEEIWPVVPPDELSWQWPNTGRHYYWSVTD